MGFNGINGQEVQKAFDIVNEITEYGNLKKYKITLSDFDGFYIGLQELYNAGKTETMTDVVKNLFVKCGFKAEPDGIGWKINGII